MGRGQLTIEEQRILKDNRYVLDVNESAISYTNEFKFHFMEEYMDGKKPTQIFRDAGFDVKMLGSKRIERATARWKESYQAGSLGTKYVFFRKSGDADIVACSHQDKSEKQKVLVERCCEQEQQIKELIAEIKLLQMIRKYEEAETGYRISTRDICNLIEELAKEQQYSITSLCKAAGFSRNTFYKMRKRDREL